MHFRFTQGSNRPRYLLYPILSLVLLTAAHSRAQDAPATQPPATPPDAAAPAPDTAQPPATAPDAQPRQQQPQSPQERAKVLRDAQARVRARKAARTAALIADTYQHKFEAYFGGGYLRFRPGSTLQHDTEGDWNVGVTDYIRPRLGITADFRGYYGTTYTGNNQYNVHNPSISQYTFLAGPQYRITQGPKWATSIQLLAGGGHGNFDTGTGGLPSSYLGLYPESTVFNASAAAILDYNLGPALALRVSPGVLFSTYGSEFQHNLGFNIGVVYRFGHKK
jgi:hypothetical protein